LQINNRVRDELAWAMKRDIPSPSRGNEIDALRGALLLANEDVCVLCAPSKRNDCVVLEEEQHIAIAACDAALHEVLLQCVRALIADAAEPIRRDRSLLLRCHRFSRL